MPDKGREVGVGLDNGGTAINATVLDSAGGFLVDRLLETPSRVSEGPQVAIEALAESFSRVLRLTGVSPDSVRAVGLDTPGPASADGVISSRGAVNFVDPAWRGFDVRGALAALLCLPVTYNNDANAAALYAHHRHFGPDAVRGSACAGEAMAMEIFREQAIALGRLLTLAANVTDPDAYFLGGGVVEAVPSFRDWFLATVREHTDLRDEQRPVATFALVPDLDMAGARGAPVAPSDTLGGPPPKVPSR